MLRQTLWYQSNRCKIAAVRQSHVEDRLKVISIFK